MSKGKGLLRRPLFCLALLASCPAAGEKLAPSAVICAGADLDAAITACSSVIRSGGLGKAVLANAYYNRATARHRRSREALAINGGEDRAAADLQRALADYTQAIRRNPAFAAAYVNRGIVWYETGQFARAVADDDAAIRLRPDLAEAWNNRSLARHRLGQYDLAKADFDQTIRLEQYYGNALINRELGPMPLPPG